VRIDLQYGDIERGIGAHQFGGEFAVIGQGHADLLGPVHDVVIGEDVTIGGNDET